MRIVAYILLATMSLTYSPSKEVTVAEFAKFIEATNYVTDAERFGWAAVAITNTEFKVVPGAYWREPDGNTTADPQHPVTQVSWYDAKMYCEWAGVELYSIKEWTAQVDWANTGVTLDTGSNGKVVDAQKNFLGNVWEWTEEGAVLGGSFLCSLNTCAGFSEEKYIHFPGKDAGCNNIGFRVKPNQ